MVVGHVQGHGAVAPGVDPERVEDCGGISNVVEDTTPQLGGDLDLNSNDITGTGNVNITGTVTATGATIASLTYPTSDGTSGQVLTTNGSGTLSFQPVTETDPSALAFAIALG